jgi:hypothetical protein
MSNQIELQPPDKPLKLCSWCDIPLAKASYYEESVCIRCYKLLVSAGLTDGEILKDKTKEADKRDLGNSNQGDK